MSSSSHTNSARNDVAMGGSIAIAWSPNSFRDQAIAIEPIMFEVMKNLDRVGEPKKKLLQIALLNKKLLNPALDVIWETMHSLTPFLNLLPQNVVRDQNSEWKIFTLDYPATENETFAKYAKRLRSLVHTPFETYCPLAVTYLLSLQNQTSNPKPLFPGLTKVSFTSNFIPQPIAAQAMMALQSPITKLEFTSLEVETSTFAFTLAVFSTRFPNSLKDLTLELPVAARLFTMRSLVSLKNFQALERLTLVCANVHFPLYDLIGWIVGLEALKVLEVDVRVQITDEQAVEMHSATERDPPRVHALSTVLRSLSLCGPVRFIGCVLPFFKVNGVREAVRLVPTDGVGPEADGEIRQFVQKYFPGLPEFVF